MVCFQSTVDLGKRKKREAVEVEMDLGTERSRPVHNFKLPLLKWGKQKILRCMIVQDPNGGKIVSSDRGYCSSLGVERGLIRRPRENERKESLKKPAAASWVKSKAAAEGDGIEAVMGKLMFDLQEAADKMKGALLRESLDEEEQEPAAEVAVEADDDARPWKLRTRRAACKAPNGVNVDIDGGGSGSGGPTVNVGVSNGLKLCRDLTAEGLIGEKRERSRFSVSLSRREIEEDFRALTGNRPPRRPRKRPKIVQKELDTLFPGLWLTEVTADMYKVPDAPET
ncbi:hypothetical protein Vadar_027470 [Vaccinium darrowii]|uniref:Uncharacterized protein n=1 Tax=Vaccinium darrowii TaxID=229202 RepID=A0ACB7XKM4_9ERIC|nr:hypothetical protein Vadar_027470 [Vaccinium darrowii]